jgi:hypothetical protein
MPKMTNATATISQGIHSGDVTHHQDQVITPVNFNTRKTINRTVQKPIPLLLVCTVLLIFFQSLGTPCRI